MLISGLDAHNTQPDKDGQAMVPSEHRQVVFWHKSGSNLVANGDLNSPLTSSLSFVDLLKLVKGYNNKL